MNAYRTLYFFCFGIKWNDVFDFEDFAHVSQQIRIDTMMQGAIKTAEDCAFEFADLDF